MEKRDTTEINVIIFLSLIEEITNGIFRKKERREQIEELKSKRVKFFLRRKIIEEIVAEIAGIIDEINRKNERKIRRKPVSQRRKIEIEIRKIMKYPKVDKMDERASKEIRKIVEMKLNRIMSQE